MHYLPVGVILGGGVDCPQPISVYVVLGGITNSVTFITLCFTQARQ